MKMTQRNMKITTNFHSEEQAKNYFVGVSKIIRKIHVRHIARKARVN